MYEIRLCDDKYGVFNASDECLCIFRLLNVAADFVAYIQGGKLTETQKFHVDEEIRNFRNFRKQ